MDGFAVISDFEFCCVFIEDHSADWVSKHYLSLNLMEESTFCLLWLMVKQAFGVLRFLLR
jgi:hypothetical protein